jgi:hypothetical protein
MAALSVVIPTAVPAMTVEAEKCTTFFPDVTVCSTQGKNPSTSVTHCSDSATPCTIVTDTTPATHKGAAQSAVDYQQRCKQVSPEICTTNNNGK